MCHHCVLVRIYFIDFIQLKFILCSHSPLSKCDIVVIEFHVKESVTVNYVYTRFKVERVKSILDSNIVMKYYI